MAEPAESATGVRSLEDEATLDAILTSEPVVLLEFYAEWCGPCTLMDPVLEEVATAVDAPIVKIDVEEHPVVGAEYDVRAVPTFVVVEDGTPTETLVGAQEKAALVGRVRR